jgi:hypothetical protein
MHTLSELELPFPGASGVKLLREAGKARVKGMVIKTTHGHATVVKSSSQIDGPLWAEALKAHCQDHRYYEVVEETLGDDFEHRYLILNNETTGAVAVQPFFMVTQDITAGLPMRIRALVMRVRKKFPRFLNMRILMVGCAAGEGQLDSCEPWAVESLLETLDQYARQIGAPVILLKDFPASYRKCFASLGGKGYKRVPSMPGTSLKLDFKNFEDYMTTKLSRIYRKGLRRKFHEAERLGAVTMEVVDDVTPYVDEVYPLYLQTYERSDFKFERLTKEYLSELGQRMPERMRYFLWRHQGRMVAFAVCMIHEGTLYDLNVGMDYAVALDLHMYFVTWRDIISWAIEAKLKVYHTGPLNYDPKLHLRMDLFPLDLYARHTSPLINPIFGWAMSFLQPVRHDATLRKFANADELWA